MMFNQEKILQNMETLQYPNGAFTASDPEKIKDYCYVWLRDHLFMTYSYAYLGTKFHEKAARGVQVVFDIFRAHQHKLERAVQPRDREGKLIVRELIHAKYDPETLRELTIEWGHHQLDVLGLFLYIIASLNYKNITVIRDEIDRNIIQLLIFYLRDVRYWSDPDNGMWEDCFIRHSSSIGAVISGLTEVKQHRLAVVPSELIAKGENELYRILPHESLDQCSKSGHDHSCDAAQLFLIWPFHVLSRKREDEILDRIMNGFEAQNGQRHKLMRPQGISRFYGDTYYSSSDGSPAQWQWDFLISIIYSQRNDEEQALHWFRRGAERITPEGYITEAYSNGKPNPHTPLGWMHALALIAYSKLNDKWPEQTKEAFPLV